MPIRKNLGILAIFVLILIPLARWLFITPLNLRFFDFLSTMTSLGQITGIIGLALFSINLILSARFKIIENFLYGLNKVYNFHHQIGGLAFILILFHPLFLVISYLSISLKSAADFFTPFNNLAISYGILSLLLMIVLLILTFYVNLRYQNWKFSHKFLVAVFILALLHALYIPSDISRDAVLRVYLISLGFIGLAAGFYQAFLSPWLNLHPIYNLKKINPLNSRIVELELEPRRQKINFFPGQFVFIRFLSGAIGSESHPFSISSASATNNLQLVIKSLGDFTAKLKDLSPGLPVAVEGPYGKFSHLNILNKNQIWIAGGVGITPFLSMARSLDNNYQVDLYYCVNKPEEAVLLSELQEIAKTKNLRVIPWYSSEKGYLNAGRILELSPDLNNRDILLCGPTAFMFSLKDQLRKFKIKRKNIHFENFQLI